MKFKEKQIQFSSVPAPEPEIQLIPVPLNDQTMKQRYDKVLNEMRNQGFSSIVIYEDLEHGSNFEYLTGFLTRFEEALLILNDNGSVYYVLGNENLKLAKHARLKGEVIHCPQFSLPNQPMFEGKSMEKLINPDLFNTEKKVGLVGWKLFTGKTNTNQLFDLPHYIVETIKKHVDDNKLENATSIFIGDSGVRTINNSNEIAHYEFGSSLASAQMLKTLELVDMDVTEMELGNSLNAYGQRNSVVTIAAAGQRFEQANLYPTDKLVSLGDTLSLTVGYKGGLQSRSAFIARNKSDLPENQQDYLTRIVFPYFKAVASWLETVHIGMKGKEVYDLIEKVLPKEKYGWHLNPGHYVADEEWMASPIYPNSEVVLKSGMMLQVDIIPSIKGMAGTSAEGSVVLANEKLQQNIRKSYPELWTRIENRRSYVTQVLGIELNKDILLMGNATPYLRPYLLDEKNAVNIK